MLYYSQNLQKKLNLFFKYIHKDRLVLYLLISNIFTIIIAVIEHWDLRCVLFIYWCQNIIIGFFNFIRILSLKIFSTKEVYFFNSYKPVPPIKKTKILAAFIFLFYYSFFHFGYLKLITKLVDLKSLNLVFIILTSASFFISHLFSFLDQLRENMDKPNIGVIMYFPCFRIIPMHLTIVFGALLFSGKIATLYLIFFLVLKTIADIKMHMVETEYYKTD